MITKEMVEALFPTKYIYFKDSEYLDDIFKKQDSTECISDVTIKLRDIKAWADCPNDATDFENKDDKTILYFYDRTNMIVLENYVAFHLMMEKFHKQQTYLFKLIQNN